MVSNESKGSKQKPETPDTMNELFINDETLGEPFIGTRAQFKAALMEQFMTWHTECNTPMTLDAFIDSNLDDYLSPATDADIALYPGIS